MGNDLIAAVNDNQPEEEISPEERVRLRDIAIDFFKTINFKGQREDHLVSTGKIVEQYRKAHGENPSLLQIIEAFGNQSLELQTVAESQGPVSEKVRQNNAKRLNKQQLAFLKSDKKHINPSAFAWQDSRKQKKAKNLCIEKLSPPPKKRTLYLYYREGQMDPMEFNGSLWLLSKYIKNGHSKVFSDIKVVSRSESSSETVSRWETLAGENVYDSSKDHAFVANTSAAANIIHFSHGSPEQSMYGSIPIIGSDLVKDKERTETATENLAQAGMPGPVPLDLEYIYSTGGNGSLPEVMGKVLDSVKQLEKAMLESAQAGLAQETSSEVKMALAA